MCSTIHARRGRASSCVRSPVRTIPSERIGKRMNIQNAKCLVTGCSSGIGRAIAIALAGAGARVWATGRRREPIDDLKTQGLSVLELDVRDDDAVRRAVQLAGPIDILVNSA